MPGYVTALPDPQAARDCAASLAALWRADGSGVLLDASVWPNRDDAAACAEPPAAAKVAAFLEASGGGETVPWVLVPVAGESIGMLEGIARALGSDDAILPAEVVVRRGAVPPVRVDRAWIRKCVRFLDALDRSEQLSKEPGGKGRRTDLRLVATALHEGWRGPRPMVIATRDEDVRRLAQGAASWNAAQSSPRAAPAVRVFKLDRETGRYRCYFDAAADALPPLAHPAASEVADAWAALG